MQCCGCKQQKEQLKNTFHKSNALIGKNKDSCPFAIYKIILHNFKATLYFYFILFNPVSFAVANTKQIEDHPLSKISS